MEPDDKTAISRPQRVAADDATRITRPDGAAAPAEATQIIDDNRTRVTDAAQHTGASRSASGTFTGGISASRQAAGIAVGATINRRFTLQELLGSGGMGQVYRAIDERKREAGDDNPYVAIKLLQSSFASHPASFVALQREAKKTQTLAHPNIVTVYDFDRDDAVVYMTMEELRGVSLDRLLQDNPPDRKRALKIIREIAVALAYAHSKGLVHSDLKPGNIFVTDSGGVKVLDFGIARAMGQGENADSFDAGQLGALTPKYASLEMFQGAQPDPRDDIYALGIIACRLLGGEHPYRGKSAYDVSTAPMSPVLPQVGRLLRSLLKKSVALRAPERVANIETFIKRFDFAAGGYKKVVAAGVVVIAVAVGNIVYWSFFNESYPALSSLPVEQQQKFHHLVDEANGALAVGDINGALFYLDDAYAIQKKDKDIDRLSARILSAVKQSTSGADADTQRQAFDALRQHPVFEDLR